ncbi:UDP-glucose 4-epimerase [Actinomyces sp. Chiba101]|uniref:UDP-glucose 4-epimerase GalE n=1 Tax=Actinomyces TaxID=1654 RepID=UPI000974E24F|nr:MULTISPECIES: UDP-glucose 4-epimerase GalE [Actinomyces]BAW93840.1 UDP-glucose 4-epimerase [Actinomyces sp. Chiba101]GAV93907.1 UDP-glucose 4-epimerase GalE [Actinomyces denticolens]SUU74346.1 UDP-glucose 4-epimerase [Actinomyces denticolens]
MSILVAGGAGYIGAHVVRLLLERGDEVIVVDDLSYGSPSRVEGATLVELDVAAGDAPERLTEVMRERGVTAVIHFAARKQVGESVARPAWYYQQNVGGLANMMLAMEAAGVDQMIFSSSAAVYGMPPVEVVPEDIDCRPINPYGETKLIGEWMMADAETAWGLRWAGLRYFNVAGAGWDDLGDMATLNLIPMVMDRLAKGETPKIFGTDYPTPDGTCIRDYIHVRDLAAAHIAALDYLAGGKEMAEHIFNVGTGVGASVRDVVAKVIAATGLDIAPEELPRRAGDPPQLIGNAERIGAVLGWRAEHDLDDIVASSYSAWQADPNRTHFA